MKTLPASDLAERALGQSAALIMGADRSNLPYELRLFTHAYAPPTQYGLCASDWVTLRLDDGHIWSISADTRFGAVDSIYVDSEKSNEERNARLCASVKDTRGYFPAPDWIAAQTVVAYIDYLAGRGPSKAKAYEFECTGSCKNIDVKKYLKEISLRDITAVSELDCAQSATYQSCYKITLTGSPPGLFPRELRVYGMKRMHNVELSQVKLWIGQTAF